MPMTQLLVMTPFSGKPRQEAPRACKLILAEGIHLDAVLAIHLFSISNPPLWSK